MSWRVSGNPYQGIPVPGQQSSVSPSSLESKSRSVRQGLTDAAPFTGARLTDRKAIEQPTSPPVRSTSRPVDSKLGSAEQEAGLDQIKAACRPQHGPSASSSTLNDAIRSAAAIEPFPAHAVLETLMNASVDPARSPLTANPLHDPGAQERTLAKQFLAAYLEVRGGAASPDLAAFVEKSLSQPDTHQFNIHVLPSIIEFPRDRMNTGQLPLVESLWALDGNAWIRPVTEQFAKSGIDLVDRFFPHLIYRQTPSPERLSLLIDQYAKRDELPELCRALELPWFKDVKAGVFVADPSHKHRDLFAAQVKMFFGKTFASCSLDQVAKLANAYSLACMWSGEADNESLVRALVMRCVQVHPDDQRTESFNEVMRSIVYSAHISARRTGAEAVLLDGLVAAIGKTGPANWRRTVEVFLAHPAGAGQWMPDERREYLSNSIMQEAGNLTVTQLSGAIYCIARSGEKEGGRPQRSGLLQAMEALKKSPCGTWRAGHVAAVAHGMAKAIVHTGSQEVADWLRSELAAFNFEDDVLVEVNAALDQEFRHWVP